MKTNKILGIVIIMAMLLTLVPAGSVLASPVSKVDVCHKDDMGVFHLINISDNAFPAHQEHGDAYAGDLVPGMPGKKFTLDCSVIDVKTLVDTVIVPSNGAIVYSTAILTSGVTYELVASGTYRFANWGEAGIADARCSFRIPGSYNNTGANAWIDGSIFPGSLQYYLQVWANGSHVTWGTGCDMTHIYTGSLLGGGTTANFKIWDDYYGDNVGSITVQIFMYN